MPLSRSDQARLNGAKSRGPITPQGKAVSSMNALRHGRRTKRVPVAPHGPEFEKLFNSLIAQFAPRSAAESALVHQVAAASWHIRHWRRIEAAVMKRIYNRFCPASDEPGTYATIAAALESSFIGPSLLGFILRRQSACRVAQDRALRTLRLHQQQGNALTAPMAETFRQNVAQDDLFEIAITPQCQAQVTHYKALTRQAPETSEPKRTCDTDSSSHPQSQSSPAASAIQPPHPTAARDSFFALSEMLEKSPQPAEFKPLTSPRSQTSEPKRTCDRIATAHLRHKQAGVPLTGHEDTAGSFDIPGSGRVCPSTM